MAELEDLRGKTLAWFVSQRRPLLCAVTGQGTKGGRLLQSDRYGPIRASLAGVGWSFRIVQGDVLTFDGGPTVAVAQRSLGGYEAEIDGSARYRFVRVAPNRNDWLDAAGRHAVLLRRHRHSAYNESGEIIISVTSTIEHAPVLILLGIVNLVG